MAEKISTVKLLREKGVKPKREVLERLKEQREIKKKIMECLKEGEKTIPEIAAEVKLPLPVVTWYVMSMRKYGEIEEGEEDGEYYRYRMGEKNED